MPEVWVSKVAWPAFVYGPERTSHKILACPERNKNVFNKRGKLIDEIRHTISGEMIKKEGMAIRRAKRCRFISFSGYFADQKYRGQGKPNP